MKLVKVTFLFLFLLCFSSCENNKKNLLENNILDSLYTISIKKDYSYRKRLELSKKIIREEKVNDSVRYLILNNLSFLYNKLGYVDSAIFCTKKMFYLDFLNKKEGLKGKIFYKLGYYNYRKNLKDSSYYYYISSKNEFLKINDSINIANRYRNIAIIESDFGDYTNSDISAVNGLKYLNGKQDKSIISLYNCLAINSKKQQLYNQAIYNYKKTLSYSLTENQKNTIQNNISNVYKEQKDYSKSISTLENLLKDTITNLKTKARIIDNLAHIKWLQNSNKKVLKDLLLAKSIRINENDTNGLIASYGHLSEYFFKKDKSKSLFYANKMYVISKQEKSPQDQIEAIDKIVALQTSQKSIKYYKESIRLRDSLKEAETKRQYKFAKIKYNYEEEEKQKLKFKTLATENKLIAEQENNQKKNVLIIGILLTSGLLFLIYRRKQQHKKQILQENYNTETRIARRLHDELGNGIYNAIIKVQNPKFENEEIINDLDKIYLKTRAISHENDAIETGIDFENYFKDLVSSYNSVTCKIILKDLSSLDLNNLNKDKQIVIYRVFNELFVNMKKHSKASLVVLSCKKKNKSLEIIYVDNGVGFKENTIVFKNGLKNMETRIKTINGTINFENKPDKGLKVSIHFKK
ncbi:sensor histidine kinase [Polaribacter sp. Hel1_85]|uniref:sensor histidine kinase n=1 Tax=Polaribacter sp. Hel1_85 TaxID=1250005 RepID=UPI00052C82BF|nr:ATP-binding protein [Polaribacter sp. Hel1_85]KGL62918.1 two-component system sensor histidine kinase [Polaribacter sp. Hel1_85]